MSENTNPDEIRESLRKEAREEAKNDYMNSCELPTKGVIEKHMAELEARGVTAELQCADDDLVEVRVLPSERPDDERQSICRDCAVRHAREVGLV